MINPLASKCPYYELVMETMALTSWSGLTIFFFKKKHGVGGMHKYKINLLRKRLY